MIDVNLIDRMYAPPVGPKRRSLWERFRDWLGGDELRRLRQVMADAERCTKLPERYYDDYLLADSVEAYRERYPDTKPRGTRWEAMLGK